jgi:hypothetical protein
MKILGISGTVAVIINIGEGSVLQSHVGVVGEDGESAEIPACFDLVFFCFHPKRICRVSCNYDRMGCKKQEMEKEIVFIFHPEEFQFFNMIKINIIFAF